MNSSLLLCIIVILHGGQYWAAFTVHPHAEHPQVLAGNCSQAKDSDMVYHEIVERDSIPLISRNVTTTWYGDEKLFCIKVLNEYNKQYGKGGGSVFIKRGGLSHHYVTIEMHSLKGGQMSFLIFLYGSKV